MTYEQKLKAYAVTVLERIVSGDKGYKDSDLRDCIDVLFG
jgi:hypothetical protein